MTAEEDIAKYRARHRTQAAAELRQMKDTLASRFFKEYVQKEGLEVRDTGLFDISSAARRERSEDGSTLMTIIKSLHQLRTMEPGHVSNILTDHQTRTPLIARMVERTEPDVATMSESEYLAMRSQTERTTQFKPIQRWQYPEISKRRQLVTK
jgi:hypothetical protein